MNQTNEISVNEPKEEKLFDFKMQLDESLDLTPALRQAIEQTYTMLSIEGICDEVDEEELAIIGLNTEITCIDSETFLFYLNGEAYVISINSQ